MLAALRATNQVALDASSIEASQVVTRQ